MRLLKKMEDRPQSASVVSAVLAEDGIAVKARRGMSRLLLAAGLIIALGIAGAFALKPSGEKGEPEPPPTPPVTAPEATQPLPVEVTGMTEPGPPPRPPVEPIVPSPSPKPSIDTLARGTHVLGTAPDNVVAVAHDDKEKFTVVAFSPDGKLFAAGTKTGLVQVWACHWKLELDPGASRNIARSPSRVLEQ